MDNREKLLELVEQMSPEGKDYVIMAFVKWCTNEEVGDMCHRNEITLFEDDEDEEDDYEPDPDDYDDSMDGDHASALASCGWGTDEDYGYYGGDEW